MKHNWKELEVLGGVAAGLIALSLAFGGCAAPRLPMSEGVSLDGKAYTMLSTAQQTRLTRDSVTYVVLGDPWMAEILRRK